MILVDCETLQRLLQAVGLKSFIEGLAQTIEYDFRRWSDFQTIPRAATHFSQGVIELMPISDADWYAFKYVNGHPLNTASGLLTVTGIGMLAQTSTGYPVLIAEMTILTALRTAATSALAARCMAGARRSIMALIGTGAQAEFQALAFAYLLGVKQIRYYDIDARAMDKFESNLQGGPLELIRCASVAETLAGADIITTATAAKRRQSLFPAELVSAGTHINAIGGDCPGKTELDPALVAKARTVVEYLPQSSVEGEIQLHAGKLQVAELWEVLSGRKPGRQSEAEITLFDSVGFALEDFSTLRYVHRLCGDIGIQSSTSLVPKLSDPRNLFGYIRVTEPKVPSHAASPQARLY